MRKYLTLYTLLFLITITGWVMGTETPGQNTRDEKKQTQTTENITSNLDTEIMHPQVTPLDHTGKPLPANEIKLMSTIKTCGQCHDTQYINSHNTHFSKTVQANCIVCHFKESRNDNNTGPIHLLIQQPTNQHCGQCHGLVHTENTPVLIPGDFSRLDPGLDMNGNRMEIPYASLDEVYNDQIDLNNMTTPLPTTYNLTQQTGIIMASQDLFDSALNLEGKEQLHFPWDVHVRRQLDCTACHFIGNDPRFCGNLPADLGHLKMDPRKIKSPGEVLKRPDHRLKTAACTCCHEPLAIHQSLPYSQRHMEVLSCQACHVPSVHGPAFRSVDQTVSTADGKARIEFQGLDNNENFHQSLNTKFLHGFIPSLFPHINPNPNDRRNRLISPFNFVTYWYWRSAKTQENIPFNTIKKAFLNDSGYRPEILHLLDKNKDQAIDNQELQLDTEEKIHQVKANLENLGVEEPEITGTVQAYRINHGIRNTTHMKQDCSYCHGHPANFNQPLLLSSTSPSGIVPSLAPSTLPFINGTITRDHSGAIILSRNLEIPGYYIPGHSRNRTLDSIGLWIFILAILAILFHAGFRWISSRQHPRPHTPSRPAYMYRFYERLWHWTMASGIIILAITGLEIHYTGQFQLFGLNAAVAIHNILAAILIINAALSLFYHLVTGEIKQFFHFNRQFIQETLVQTWYYIYGMFKGSPHPIPKTTERKLNPLQQLTYIFLLNILLPFQVITGMLMMAVGQWPAFAEKTGGLSLIAPIHNLGSWFFLTFLVVHIYLTTTGHTVFSNIKAMITGYDEVAIDQPDPLHSKLKDMKIIDLVGTLINKNKRNELVKNQLQPSPKGGETNE